MKPSTKLQLKYFAIALGFIVVVTVLWRVVPELSDWIAVDSILVGGLVGMLVSSVGSAYAFGNRDAAP